MALITRLIRFSFTFGITTILSAQTLDMGARGLALANAAVSVSDLPFEPANPASGYVQGSSRVSFTIGQAHALRELRYTTLVAALPVRAALFGLTIDSFGFEAYRLLTGSIVASTRVSSTTRLGGRLTGRRLSVSNYGSRGTIGLSAGWVTAVNNDVSLGGTWRYLGAPTEPAERLLIQELAFGFSALVLPGARILGAAVHETGTHVDWRVGTEVALAERLLARFGSGSNPDRIAIGFGLVLASISIDLGVSFHPILGTSAAVSVSLQ